MSKIALPNTFKPAPAKVQGPTVTIPAKQLTDAQVDYIPGIVSEAPVMEYKAPEERKRKRVVTGGPGCLVERKAS